jgi:DNA repair protein RecN (Recombination protein N)
MLVRLYIKDFAIVDELEVRFENGLLVITGETGAGKSVIIGALALLCGERGHSDLVRSGSSKAILEAEFNVQKKEDLHTQLERLNVDKFNGSILLRREINQSGVSRAFINDSPVNITDLGKLSSLLIDLHGQHQHQRLIHPENHILYLDAFGRLEPLLLDYALIFEHYNTITKELESLIEQRKSSYERHDLYMYQIDELEKANLEPAELQRLAQERKILENSERLFDATKTVSEILYLAEDSAQKHVIEAIDQFKSIANFDNKISEHLQGLESTQVTLEEIGRFCEQYSGSLEFDPQRLEEIRNREAELTWLLKKYQVHTIDALIAHKLDMKKQISLLENFDEKIEELSAKQKEERKKLQKFAIELSDVRKKIAKDFETKLKKLLNSVGLKDSRFKVQIQWQEDEKGIVLLNNKRFRLTSQGLDIVEFHVGLNVGEPTRPLHRIASGGEVSRIMLCIKSLIADSDEIETLVFDEIDSGISGRFAQIVGNKMKEISKNHQLIVITHLPQIAAKGLFQYSVNKIEVNGRTRVEIKKLNFEQRVSDIAKLLSGNDITSSALASAKELLTQKCEV